MRRSTRVASSSATCGNAGYDASSLSPRRPGQRCSSAPSCHAGELRADLTDLVAERDHPVEARPGELAQVRGGVAGDVDATLGHHRDRVGVERFGVAPALRGSIVRPERSISNASAICERELLPVHRNKIRGPATGRTRQGGWRDEPGPGWRCSPAPARRCGTGEFGAVVRVPTVRGAASRGDQSGTPELGKVVGDQVLRCADERRQLPNTPITRATART